MATGSLKSSEEQYGGNLYLQIHVILWGFLNCCTFTAFTSCLNIPFLRKVYFKSIILIVALAFVFSCLKIEVGRKQRFSSHLIQLLIVIIFFPL